MEDVLKSHVTQLSPLVSGSSVRCLASPQRPGHRCRRRKAVPELQHIVSRADQPTPIRIQARDSRAVAGVGHGLDQQRLDLLLVVRFADDGAERLEIPAAGWPPTAEKLWLQSERLLEAFN